MAQAVNSLAGRGEDVWGVVTRAEAGARYSSRLGCKVGVRGSWRSELVPRPRQASLQRQAGLSSAGLHPQDCLLSSPPDKVLVSP